MARRDASLTIRFEGETVPAVPGETLLASLLAADHRAQGWAKDGSPRGGFCGMGECHDCAVVVDGRTGTRACVTRVRDGMVVERQPARPDPRSPALRVLAEAPASGPHRTVDVLVVGAGPAGLAAAEAARLAGASVLVVDERPAPGGQFFRQPGTTDSPDRQARTGASLAARVAALGADVLGDTLVWGVERRPDASLRVACLLADGTPLTIDPRRLVVATGAMEATPVFPGWTLPGVMTTGAVQTLLRGSGAAPSGRVLVAGNGPLNFEVAVALVRRGCRVVGVVEAAPAPWTRPRKAASLLLSGPALAGSGIGHLAFLAGAGVPVHWTCRVLRVDGGERAARAVVAPVGGDAAARVIEADTVAVGEGFRPAAELPRLLGCLQEPDGRGGLQVQRNTVGATSLPDVFVAGEAGRFGGAAVALAQGALAGREAARQLGFAPRGTATASQRDLARHEAFQTALWQLFAAPKPGLGRADDDTVLCRCEALTLGALRSAVATHGIADLSTLKRLTRAGMGRCQGRGCAGSLAELLAIRPGGERDGFAPQMPLRPVPLAALAREKPEWGGHRRSLLPAWTSVRPAGDDRVPRTAEVAVIGAGIVGLSTALFLSRAGHDVLVIDRAEPNALASGGNAGSLHAQLLSFDHGSRAAGGGGPAARTLPLQRDAIALWVALERDLRADFEIAVTGGLTVAETEADLLFLDAKAKVERAHGIACDLIGPQALRDLEPALSERLIGAAYCPLEGKINPLLATQGIAGAAQAAGARLLTRADVLSIARERGRGFLIGTGRGPVRAGRVVNAAGAFASAVSRMLDADIPVYGAPLQMAVTEPAAPALSRLVAHAHRHLTLKQAADGGFLIGGGWTAGLDPVHHHPRPLLDSLEGNLWVAQHVMPDLGKLHVVRSWAAMNIDIDGAPILGEDPRVPGLFHAVTSNGYTLGPLVGRITAQLLAEGRADRDVSSFSVSRFGG